MNKIWNELLQYETRDLVERFVNKRHGKALNANRALQINSNFIQGRAYFESAEKASFTVRPLLQYYGVMALSKGLILSLDYSKTEAQLKSSHGLEVKNWKEIIKSKQYENLEITIGNGTFWELISVTKNSNYLRANSTKINYYAPMTPSKIGNIFTLKQLINYFPDLRKEYFSWIEEELAFEVLRSVNIDSSKDKVEVLLNGEIDKKKLELYFHRNHCPDWKIGYSGINTLIVFDKKEWFPNVTQMWHSSHDIGDACIVPTLPNDIGLNMISSLYMISYVLGMMARYFPTAWISLKRSEKGDKIYPFVYRILDFIHEKFPIIILDFLNAPYGFK
ncbi:MAG: YaaC family protein [Candidatus Izemoplasmatales bacterium]